MFFSGLGTATPPRHYRQSECWDALRRAPQFNRLQPRSRALCRRIFGGTNGISARYLALDRLDEAFEITPDALHARFARHAPAVGVAAARQALNDSGLAIESIDALVVSTCTGYLCPGLTSYLGEQLGLRPDALLLDLVGQGCGAALPNLRTAESLLASDRCHSVLSVCVEICSAAFYLDDDPGVLISACLFGDGAAAAVLTRQLRPGRRPVRWVDTETFQSAADRDYLRFETRGGLLRNILAPQVPALAAKHAETVLSSLLARRGLDRAGIGTWLLHAGGREVLAALRQRLVLEPSATDLSAEILDRHGNLSSPFVLFVLDAALRRNRPGGWWWMASFGAGFSSHGALLHVE